MENFSLEYIISLVRFSINEFISNINIFYLGIISVIFSSIFFLFNLYNYNLKQYFTSNNIFKIHYPVFLIPLVIVVAVFYIIFAVFYTSKSSTSLIKYIAKEDKSSEFVKIWDLGKDKWKEYFIFYIVYSLIIIFLSLIYIIFVTVIFSKLSLIFTILLLILSFIILIPLSILLAYIAVRLVVLDNVDIIDSLKISLNSIYANKLLYTKLILGYLLFVTIIFSVILSFIETIISSVVKVLFFKSFILGVISIIIGILILTYLSSLISVINSIYWTKVYLQLKETKVISF